MNIEIICIGNLKEKYWKDAVKEYSARISKYGKLHTLEIKEVQLPAKSGDVGELKVKEDEGKRILSKIKERSYVIALDVKGKAFSSEKLAEKIKNLAISGKSHITFVIGGSLGLSQEVLNSSDLRISFSDMTFPHQMMRVILLEQIYRTYKINNNETYHK